MLYFVAVLCFISALEAGDIPIQDCGSSALVERITFDGCDEFPCVVHHGSTANGKLYMTAMVATNSLTCAITGVIVGGIELPFNGCPKNACEHMSEGDCPTEEGEALVYDIDIPIENFFPTIEILGRIKLQDDNGDDFVCFEIPMKIEA